MLGNNKILILKMFFTGSSSGDGARAGAFGISAAFPSSLPGESVTRIRTKAMGVPSCGRNEIS